MRADLEKRAKAGGKGAGAFQKLLDADDALRSTVADQAAQTAILTSAPDPVKAQSDALTQAGRTATKFRKMASGAGVNKPTRPGATGHQTGILSSTRSYSILGGNS